MIVGFARTLERAKEVDTVRDLSADFEPTGDIRMSWKKSHYHHPGLLNNALRLHWES
jgi:hypothetical protein